MGSGEGLPPPWILPTIVLSGLVLAVCPLFQGPMRDDGARRAELATHERDTASRIAPPPLTGGETLPEASRMRHNEANGCGMSPAPVFTLEALGSMTTVPAPVPAADRYRISVDLSAVVSSHLDHISEITGQSKSAIVAASFLDALPALLARADGLKKLHQQMVQQQKVKK